MLFFRHVVREDAVIFGAKLATYHEIFTAAPVSFCEVKHRDLIAYIWLLATGHTLDYRMISS